MGVSAWPRVGGDKATGAEGSLALFGARKRVLVVRAPGHGRRGGERRHAQRNLAFVLRVWVLGCAVERRGAIGRWLGRCAELRGESLDEARAFWSIL